MPAPPETASMNAVTPPPPKLDTLGRVAEKLRVPVHRVAYIVSRRGIAPAAYAGRLRLFDRAGVARIRHELNAIDARRAGGAR